MMASETASACLPEHATGSLDRSTLRPVASMRAARSLHIFDVTGPGVLAVLEVRQRLVVTDRLDEVVDVVLGHPCDCYAKVIDCRR